MSPSVGGAATDAVLEGHQVTHVVVNRALPGGLASYEYPVDTGSFDRQLAKFESNPAHFRKLWGAGALTLFEVRPTAAAAWNESWLQDCGIEIEERFVFVEVGDGYRVAGTARVESDAEERSLRVEGRLEWNGSGPAPDRQLVVRLDRVPSSVPESLSGIGKPLRKLREAFGAPRERYRWATSPGNGRCPSWIAAVAPVRLDLEFRMPDSIAPGEYIVTLAARDRSVFEPVQWRDLFVDADSWRGPTLATVEVR